MALCVKTLKFALLGGALLVAVACTSQYRNHGYVPNPEELAALTPGVDTRDTVAETIGAPSASGVLNDSGYYYVRSKVRHYGARRPEVVERQVVAIGFDQAGIVRNVEHYALEDGNVVPLARRITDNGIENRSLIAQLIGNIGNFTPGDFVGQ